MSEALAIESGGARILLDPESTAGLDLAGAPSDATVLSGPEGGLSPTEHEAAIARNYVPTRLGPRVLRTETAALAALAVIQSRWGDL
jgi:16S rRNA (uracil1498-N3)-methyltransferase